MRKSVSVLLCVLMLFASVSFAHAAEEGATVQLSTALSKSLMGGELAKVTCEISNSGEIVGACIELYIDGNRIEGGSEYFMLGAHNSENFDFTVPSGLDTEFQHTLLVLLRYGNGSELYSANIFTVQKTGEISMQFSSMPLAITPGWALYYGVEFEAVR